ncbi:MAG: GNAT family N-acetyltransferase [Desulfomonile tiedjei]|nr:GNAT family N-acetyltransferase [Desulfomonile tiedjei]
MSIQFRLMNAEDIPEAMRLKDIAGWNQTVADWERFISASPEGCFAAEDDGRVVGTSTTIIYEGRFAWIGMVLVDTRYRGRGIGTQLLQRAIRYLDSRNIPCMKLDATPQGRLLYEKFGFECEYEIERWMLKRQPDENVGKRAPAEIPDVLQLDREIFGADRSTLLRSLEEESPEFTLVARQGDRVAGYVFGRPGSLADQLGPWMASNGEVAGALLDEFLLLSGRDLVFVDCVRRNPWAVPLAKAHGFEFQRSLTRMFRGTNDHAGRPELLCAILGPEFG